MEAPQRDKIGVGEEAGEEGADFGEGGRAAHVHEYEGGGAVARGGGLSYWGWRDSGEGAGSLWVVPW